MIQLPRSPAPLAGRVFARPHHAPSPASYAVSPFPAPTNAPQTTPKRPIPYRCKTNPSAKMAVPNPACYLDFCTF